MVSQPVLVDRSIENSLKRPSLYIVKLFNECESSHIAGYEMGPGSEDELTQAKRLLPAFCRRHPGVIRELVVDRGYIQGAFVTEMKRHYNIDILVPLKSSMSDYRDAITIAEKTAHWQVVDEVLNAEQAPIEKVEAVIIPQMTLWEQCQVPLNVMVAKVSTVSLSEGHQTHYYVLASTKRFTQPRYMYQRYQMRVQIEERFKQLKHNWNITDFPSPHPALMESHVAFTLLTYSLMQLYLTQASWQEKNKKVIDTLREDERIGKDAVIVYANAHYAILNLDDYTLKVIQLEGDAKLRMEALLIKNQSKKQQRTDA